MKKLNKTNHEMMALIEELLEEGDFYSSAIEATHGKLNFMEWRDRAEKIIKKSKQVDEDITDA
ncbi:DUF244 domain-containing protein [Citrobacter freundii]|uniref:DUF244 domain-containing protein n=1 Tax=Enterobacteriaceae TaxID=543 RepID=UPI001330CC49|nr:DUF244 domain-containing protein [Escherichia coli]